MLFSPFAVYYILVLLQDASATQALQSQCKPIPGSADWPVETQWQALNQTVSGRLQVPYSPGAVCHRTQSTYNNASCSALATNWTDSLWQEENPWTSMYNDNTCLPTADSPCSSAGYPAYVIAAETATDVQAGIKFAAQTGVRLIIKGTGHDVPGRSAGAGALSIWTHLLRGINVTTNDPQAVANGAVASVKLGAGMVWGDIYTEMAKVNFTVVGGADPHVGVGGWTQGAGHGPVTSYYGMGADQVLQMEVVTADGEYRTINASSHPDLFWAMRGGGPSTYAVMLSMTVKAYPQLPGVEYTFMYNSTGTLDQFWDFTASFSSLMPKLSEEGGMGYYYLVPNSFGIPNISGAVVGTFIFPAKTLDETQTLTQSLENSLKGTSPLSISSSLSSFPSFMQRWSTTNPAETVGTSTRFASWLLDEAALTHNTTKLAHVLRGSTPSANIWIGHLVAGPGVRDAVPVGGEDAVLPAWRKAYVHLLQPRSWTPLNATARKIETVTIRDDIQPALRSLAPDSGAYVNEADPSNPLWKNDYYGENYERLLGVKRRWDPRGVFWCKPCVGWDEWEVVPLGGSKEGESVYERGIGQDEVMLCRMERDDSMG